MRRILLLAALVAVAAVGLATAQTTHDLRGTWSIDVSLSGTFNNTQGWQINTMDQSSGRFAGAEAGSAPRWTIDGTANGDSVTLTTDYTGSSYVATFTGTIGAGTETMSGTWSDTNGQSGTWTGTHTSNAVPPPPPETGKTANIGVEAGKVLLRRRGTKRFVPVTADTQIPVGSEIDASKGTVSVTAATGGGASQTAEYYGGRFVFKQTKGASPVAEAVLSGKLNGCGAGRARAAAKRKKSRKLWSHVAGAFRTRGADAVATARGTRWLVQDECGGTRVKVTEGVVEVRDLRRKKTVTVAAGGSYFARRGR